MIIRVFLYPNCFIHMFTKRIFLFSFFVAIVISSGNAQSAGVAINTTGAAPHSSAILDVSSTNRGMLIPRVNLSGLTDNTTIPSAANGLLVYNESAAGTPPNDVNEGIYYWTGSSWTRLINSSSNLSANNGLTLSGSTIQLGGTLNQATNLAQAGFDFKFTGSGNVGIGVSGTPSQKLHVSGAVRAESGFVSNDGSLSTPAYRFENDPDMGLYRAGTDILGIVTNGTERLRINSTGVVSISNLSTNGIVRATGGSGTLSSSGGLINLATEVTGTLPVANGGTGATSLTGVLKGNGTSPITAITGTADFVTRWTDANTIGTGVIRDNNARVGIGVAPDPTQILRVGGRMMVDDGVIQRGGTAITGTTDLGLYSRNNGNWIRYVTNNAQHAWFTDDGIGTTARMVLDASGNLSVPTTLNGTGSRPVYADAGGVLRAASSATLTQITITSTTGQNWTVPAGVYRILVYMWGGGGGAASCVCNCAGGGAGGFVAGQIEVVPGETLTITAGAGGLGNNCSGGGRGGKGSTIYRGTTLLAAAGGGGGGSYNSTSYPGRYGGWALGTSVNGGDGCNNASQAASGNSFIGGMVPTSVILRGNNTLGSGTSCGGSNVYPYGTEYAVWGSEWGRGARSTYGEAGIQGGVVIFY